MWMPALLKVPSVALCTLVLSMQRSPLKSNNTLTFFSLGAIQPRRSKLRPGTAGRARTTAATAPACTPHLVHCCVLITVTGNFTILIFDLLFYYFDSFYKVTQSDSFFLFLLFFTHGSGLARCQLSGIDTWCPKSRRWVEQHLEDVYGASWRVEQEDYVYSNTAATQ